MPEVVGGELQFVAVDAHAARGWRHDAGIVDQQVETTPGVGGPRRQLVSRFPHRILVRKVEMQDVDERGRVRRADPLRRGLPGP